MQKHFIIMGVCGCGKSTVGSMLAKALNIPFFDGDDFHPQSNRAKMKRMEALDDKDRIPWLQKLASLLQTHQLGCVIACSALKKKYRATLAATTAIRLIHLDGDQETLLERLKIRAQNSNHYMPIGLLESQLATLENPKSEPNCDVYDIKHKPSYIVNSILTNIL